MIHTIDTKKPIEQRVIRAAGLVPRSAKIATRTPSTVPAIRIPRNNQNAYLVPPSHLTLSLRSEIERLNNTHQTVLSHRTGAQGHTVPP